MHIVFCDRCGEPNAPINITTENLPFGHKLELCRIGCHDDFVRALAAFHAQWKRADDSYNAVKAIANAKLVKADD